MATIGILGAGASGLSAAYFLARKGHQVEVFEAAPEVGGLGRSFEVDGIPVERYYHFLCLGDHAYLKLADDLGIGSEIHWRESSTGFFARGHAYPFGTPMDLLRFKPISFAARLKFGLNILRSKGFHDWESLEEYTARDWLLSWNDEVAYAQIWEPLLKIKFGRHHSDVSAAWMWHRIFRVAHSRKYPWSRDSFGYLTRGTSALFQGLSRALKDLNVPIHLDRPAAEIVSDAPDSISVQFEAEKRTFDRLVSTVPLPVLTKLVADSSPEYAAEIGSVTYLGVVCVALLIKKQYSDYYWLNINDHDVPFNGIIEYTNLNPELTGKGYHLVYVPFYLPTDEDVFYESDEVFIDKCVRGFETVRPDFSSDWIEHAMVSRDRFAQAVCTKHFSQRVPDLRSPVPHLYVSDSVQLYPADRTISGMVDIAERISEQIDESCRVSPPST